MSVAGRAAKTTGGKKFREFTLVSEAVMANVQTAFKRSGTVKYELAEP